MALSEAQRERLEALCNQDDLVPLPGPDVCRQVQALLWPRVPRPDMATPPTVSHGEARAMPNPDRAHSGGLLGTP